MNKQYLLIEVPEDWDKNNPINNCPLTEHGCGEFGNCRDGCPLINGKDAIEIIKTENTHIQLYAVKTEEKL